MEEYHKKYNKSKKGRLSRKKYQQSEKGKLSNKKSYESKKEEISKYYKKMNKEINSQELTLEEKNNLKDIDVKKMWENLKED